jgi:hypothetical protein
MLQEKLLDAEAVIHGNRLGMRISYRLNIVVDRQLLAIQPTD